MAPKLGGWAARKIHLSGGGGSCYRFGLFVNRDRFAQSGEKSPHSKTRAHIELMCRPAGSGRKAAPMLRRSNLPSRYAGNLGKRDSIKSNHWRNNVARCGQNIMEPIIAAAIPVSSTAPAATSLASRTNG